LWLANCNFASHKNDNVTSLRSSVLQVAAQRESLSVTVIDANGVSVFANEIVPVEASAYFPQVRDITKPTFGSENPGDPLHWMPARVAWNTEMGTPGGGATLSFDSPNTCRHAWRNTLGLRRCRLHELGRGYRRHRARQRRRLVRRDRVNAARRTRPPCTPRQAFQLRFRRTPSALMATVLAFRPRMRSATTDRGAAWTERYAGMAATRRLRNVGCNDRRFRPERRAAWGPAFGGLHVLT
jgi:hypothetical protein